MSPEKDIPSTDLSKRSSLTSVSSASKDEKKPSDNASPQPDDGFSKETAAIHGPTQDEIDYPKGLSFILIIIALFLCVFLTALDMVNCPAAQILGIDLLMPTDYRGHRYT
jgi:hypothetical protein